MSPGRPPTRSPSPPGMSSTSASRWCARGPRRFTCTLSRTPRAVSSSRSTTIPRPASPTTAPTIRCICTSPSRSKTRRSPRLPAGQWGHARRRLGKSPQWRPDHHAARSVGLRRAGAQARQANALSSTAASAFPVAAVSEHCLLRPLAQRRRHAAARAF